MAAGQAFRQARGVDAGSLGQYQRLRQHRVRAADDQLVDHLGRQSGADGAHLA